MGAFTGESCIALRDPPLAGKSKTVLAMACASLAEIDRAARRKALLANC